jgi:hypothetical protein
MKVKSTPLVDEHLKSLAEMQEAGTNDFFYTRLKARMLARKTGMEKGIINSGWSFPLKPVWVISMLALLLVVNGVILSEKAETNNLKDNSSSSSLETFAKSYDQTILSSY